MIKRPPPPAPETFEPPNIPTQPETPPAPPQPTEQPSTTQTEQPSTTQTEQPSTTQTEQSSTTQTEQLPPQPTFQNNLPPRPGEIVSSESVEDEILSPPTKTPISSVSSGDIFNAISDIGIQSNSMSKILSKNLKAIDQSLKDLNLSEQQAEWNLRHINSKLDQIGSNFAVYQQAQLEISSLQAIEMRKLVEATLAQGKVIKDIWKVLMKVNGLEQGIRNIDATPNATRGNE